MLMIVRVILSLGLLVYGGLRLFGTVMFLLIGAGLLQSADVIGAPFEVCGCATLLSNLL